MDEEEPLPEIKPGTMEIADCDDPKYKVNENKNKTKLNFYIN